MFNFGIAIFYGPVNLSVDENKNHAPLPKHKKMVVLSNMVQSYSAVVQTKSAC